MLVSAAVAPTAHPNVVDPVVLTASAKAPFTVLPSAIAALLVDASTVWADGRSAGLYLCPFAVVTLPVSTVVPPAFVVRLVGGAVAPTAEPNVVVPVVLTA